ncbi:MAG: IS110 family transposase [Candidatus Omnitrophica bacterium]|nr:IS110 family transposase [Candidatus Omnitrophota bacterium]
MGQLYGAIDLHSTNSYCGVTDENDNWIKHKRLRNRIEDIEEFFNPYKDNISSIGIESTYNGYWLIDGLMEKGYVMKLGNPSQMGNYSNLKDQNDKTDTKWLAKMLRLGIFPESYIYPKEERPVRDLLRKRMLFVSTKMKINNSIDNQFQTWLNTKISQKDLLELTAEELEQLFHQKSLCLSAKSSIDIIATIDKQIDLIGKEVYKQVKETSTMKRMMKLPGIGKILGITILFESGELDRFKSMKNYVSYCRLVESKKTSNNKKKGKGNSKCGNKFLRWAYAEAAVHALKYEKINKYYQRLKQKKNAPKAMAIIASKIARITYKTMTDENFVYEHEKLFQ